MSDNATETTDATVTETAPETVTEAPPAKEYDPTNPVERDFAIQAAADKFFAKEEETTEKVSSAEDVKAETPPAEESPAEPTEEAPSVFSAQQLQALAREEERIRLERDALKGKVEEQVKSEIEKFKAEFIQSFVEDPAKYVTEQGIDPYDMGNLFFAEALGEEAPDDLRQVRTQYQDKLRYKKLEKQLEEQKRMAEEQRQQIAIQQRAEVVDQEIKAVTASLGEDTPWLSRVASTYGSESVNEALAQHYYSYIQQGQWPSVKQVAQEVEQGLAEQASFYAPAKVENKQPAKSIQTQTTESKDAITPKALSDEANRTSDHARPKITGLESDEERYEHALRIWKQLNPG